MKKIDIHIHCAGEHLVSMGNGEVPTAKDLLENIFPAADVQHAILMTAPSLTTLRSAEVFVTADYQKANEDSCALCERYPNSFSWMCNLYPQDPDFADDQSVYDQLKAYQEKGAVGFGEVVAPLWLDAPEMQRIYRCLEALDMPILLHMDTAPGVSYGVADDPGLPRLEAMLKAFPKLKFIGHSQVFWSEISMLSTPDTRGGFPADPVIPGRIEFLMEKYPNLYADLSAMSGYNALTRDLAYGVTLLRRFSNRMMYGSDMILPRRNIYTATLLDSLLELNVLSQETCENILYNNAARLFKLGKF